MQIAAEANQNSFGKLIISIHDVHPDTAEKVTDILEDLEQSGIPRVSLLVVPDYHGNQKIATEPKFCQWMNQQRAKGHEIVLHGYFHSYSPSERDRGILQHIMTQIYTAGEGEFYDLSYEAAQAKLRLGNAMLAGMGGAQGFIAPAWLLGREAERAVADAGFLYTVRLASVTDLRRQTVHKVPTLAYSTRSVWRRRVSLLWNPLLKYLTAPSPVLRVSIHPPDWEFPRLRTQILRLIAEALAVRSPMTYHEWIRSL